MRVKHTFTNPIADRDGFTGVQPSHWNADHTIEGDYATRTAAAAATISSTVDYLRTAGYSTAGDGGGALYKRVSSEPSHAGKFQSADGAWWEEVPGTRSVPIIDAISDASYTFTDQDHGSVKLLTAEVALTFPKTLFSGWVCLIIQSSDHQSTLTAASGGDLRNYLNPSGLAMEMLGLNAQARALVYNSDGESAQIFLDGGVGL